MQKLKYFFELEIQILTYIPHQHSLLVGNVLNSDLLRHLGNCSTSSAHLKITSFAQIQLSLRKSGGQADRDENLQNKIK